MFREECINTICNYFLSDTIELLDLVLFDDVEDPQYSAITTYNRFYYYLQYMKQSNMNDEDINVFSFIKECGYSSKYIDILKEKIKAEYPVYRGEKKYIDFCKKNNNL